MPLSTPPHIKRILLVDDDEEYSRLVIKKLLAEGFEVRSATSGLLAIEVLASFLPDLIILDLMMPAMSGHEFIFHLQESHGSIPVIVASAVLNEEQKEKIRFWGSVKEFLPKPNDFKDLVTAIRDLLKT
ncbi:MAG: response regulator [Planctomycetota bacterium]